MNSAITPPTQKKANDVTRYSVPIVLWSVVVSHLMLLRFLTPRLCPRRARTSHSTDETSVTKTPVTITRVPDRYGA
ncbi:hypothetical protein BZZ08_07419 [Streptomyces sp. MH60]|nr:hypothetical protein BZZ08_07419 [Streptomyces sp. MH60]